MIPCFYSGSWLIAFLMKKIVQAFLLVLVAFNVTSAQNDSKSHTVLYTVNTILELELGNTAAPDLTFEFATADDFENGKTIILASSLKVRSNKPWIVNVKSNTPNFSSATGDQNVSTNTLGVRKNGTSNFIQLSTSDQILASGPKGGFNDNTFHIDFLAKPGYILPALYTIDVVYTVSAP